jgi:hypothetical protein
VTLWRAVIVAGLLASGSTQLDAQRLADASIGASQASPFLESFRSRQPSLFTMSEGRRTYWLEGGVAGGLLLGLVGSQLSGACPPNTGSCPKPAVGFLIGASVGFVIGAFLGDTIEKDPD